MCFLYYIYHHWYGLHWADSSKRFFLHVENKFPLCGKQPFECFPSESLAHYPFSPPKEEDGQFFFFLQHWLICVWRTDVLTSEFLKWGHHLNILNSAWHSSTSTASGGVSGASHKMMSYYESQALKKLCFAFPYGSSLISSWRGVDTLSFLNQMQFQVIAFTFCL